MIITVWGTNLAPRAAGAAAIPLPTTLEGASVEVIDGSHADAHVQVTFLAPALECVPIPRSSRQMVC